MPSRLGVAVIVLFWLGVMGYVGHRDIYPRFFADAPPAIRIDLSDEATQTIPARWTIYRGKQKVGTLRTLMTYVARDDTFRFTSNYRDLVFDQDVLAYQLRMTIPEAETTLTVGRAGDLRGQSMTGQLIGRVMLGPVSVFDAKADAIVESTVSDGVLHGRVELHSPLGDIAQPLDPVPVPGGQVLNPLQPVSRLRDIRPGRRWVIHEVNPLGDALSALGRSLVQKHGGTKLLDFGGGGEKQPLVAQVSDRPVTLERKGGPVECWVIEYRGEKSSAKTWVSVAEGKVLMQEATGQGETLRLERED